jgi:hypothetical protein
LQPDGNNDAGGDEAGDGPDPGGRSYY